jgi:hypothetical protein
MKRLLDNLKGFEPKNLDLITLRNCIDEQFTKINTEI